MSGEYTNKKVGRLIAAGSRSSIDDVVSIVSRLKAIHINEYADDQEGFSLGSPSSRNDALGRQVSAYRSIVMQTGASGPSDTVPLDEARNIVDDDFYSSVQQVMDSFSRIDQIEDQINSIEANTEILRTLEPPSYRPPSARGIYFYCLFCRNMFHSFGNLRDEPSR